MFRDLTRLSAAGIPTIALVFGNSTAGGAYIPGMSDHVVMIKERSKVFLAGPPLVKMATGEESDDESLGGAEMHARISGLADYFAVDELDAIRIGRRIVARLNWRKQGPAPGPVDRAAGRRRGTARHRAGRPAHPVRSRATSSRASSTARTSTSSSRCTAARWSPAGPACTAIRSASWPTPAACCSARSRRRPPSSSSWPTGRHATAVPAQHHRLHGRQGVRAGRDHQARRDDDQRRVQLDRAAHLAADRRLLRRRQLRHVRARLRPAVPVRLAQRQVRGHGRRAARRRAVDRRAGPPARRAGRPSTRTPTPRCAPPSRRRSRRSRCRCSCPAGSTTTA